MSSNFCVPLGSGTTSFPVPVICRSAGALMALACLAALPASGRAAQASAGTGADTTRIAATARALAADSLGGRGPYSSGNRSAARLLAELLTSLGARPLVGSELLVPFTVEQRPADTAYNVLALLPNNRGSTDGPAVGITSHLDHLGVGRPDAGGDSIYNGFLDAAVPMSIVLDVARRYAASPGDRPLAVLFFNLEEQGLLGARALAAEPLGKALATRLTLLIGVDAGSPAGEALEWQLMGTVPDHAGARLADSLAQARGWTTTRSAPRPISDVFVFSELGVPILFPIPGKVWRGYTPAERDAAMQRFDHYHQPSDEWNDGFPWVGTLHFANWLWDVVRLSASR